MNQIICKRRFQKFSSKDDDLQEEMSGNLSSEKISDVKKFFKFMKPINAHALDKYFVEYESVEYEINNFN